MLLAILLSFSTLMLVSLVVVISYILHQRKKETKGQRAKAHTQNPFVIWSYDGKIMFEHIIEATKNFDNKYLIGTRGHGSIYKVEFPTSHIIAVKKLHQ